MRFHALFCLGLIACGGEKVLVSSDVRVDQADPGSDPDSESSRVCASPNGDIFAVWSDARSGIPAVWLNESTDGGLTWLDQPVLVNQGSGAATHPEIACTAEHVYVVWEDTRDGVLENKNVYLASGFRGSGGNLRFGDDDIQLDGDEDGDHHSLMPRIAAFGDHVWVVWSDQRNGAYDIYAATSADAGETFYEPRRLDSDDAGSAFSASPRIASSGADLVFVVWEDSRNGLTDIYGAMSDNGGLSFADDYRLDLGEAAGGSDSFSPQIAADDSGTAYVAWHDTRNAPGRDVYINWTSNSGASWAAEAVRVDSDNPGFADSILPSVAVACGVGHLAWQDDRGGGYDIFYRRVIGGAFADSEVRVSGGSAGAANSVDTALVASGGCDTASDATVAIAWRDLRADTDLLGYNDLYYTGSTDNGLSFEALDLRLDSLQAGTSYKVDLSIDLRDEDLRAVWVDGRSGTADVYFHGLAIGEEAVLIPVASADLVEEDAAE